MSPRDPSEANGDHKSRDDGGNRYWANISIACAAMLVYSNALSNGFTYDDIPAIVENPAFVGFPDLLRIWLTPYWPGPDAQALGLFRPLTTTLFALEWWAGSGTPLVFHFTNLLLHALASVFVYRLLRQCMEWRSSTAAALLFAVHPVHVEAVANSVGQAELLSACLVLIAVISYSARPQDAEVGPWHRLLLGSLFLGGVLCKENAIVLPLLFFATDAAQGRIRRNGYLGSVAKLGILLVGVTSVYLALRSMVLGGSLSGDVAFNLPFLRNPQTRFFTALGLWPEYARLLLFPRHLSAMYDPGTIVPVTVLSPKAAMGGVLLLFLVGSIVLRRAWPYLGFGSAWFLASILPVSNLLFPIGTLLAERTLYLPSVGLAIWVGFGLQWVLVKKSWTRVFRRVLVAGFSAILLIMGGWTFVRNPVWADNRTLFSTTLRDHPENFRAHWYQAEHLAEIGDTAESLPHWERAYAIFPSHPGFLTDYARFLLEAGEPEEGDRFANEALMIRPDGPSGLFIQGLIDIRMGRADDLERRVERLRHLGLSAMAEELADSMNVDLMHSGG